METRKIRKGSKYYDTPFFLKKARAFSILLRWIAQAIKKGDNLTNSIQKEFKDLIKGLGSTVKESQNLRNKVSINIIYSHYRWR
jgi:ribosomal protein S7